MIKASVIVGASLLLVFAWVVSIGVCVLTGIVTGWDMDGDDVSIGALSFIVGWFMIDRLDADPTPPQGPTMIHDTAQTREALVELIAMARENERLREALEELAQGDFHSSMSREIARTALKEKPQ